MYFVSVTEEHFNGIVDLVPTPDELYRIYPSATFPLDNAQLQKLMEMRKDLTVAIDANRVVAFANLYDVKQNISAFIGNVVVASSHRRMGLGKTLISYMSDLCINKYNAQAHLSVFNFNTNALILYTKLGFKPYAVEERINLKNEVVALIHLKLG